MTKSDAQTVLEALIALRQEYEEVNGTPTAQVETLVKQALLAAQRLVDATRNDAPVSLEKCAVALQGNERIKLGSDLQIIAKAVLDEAKKQGARIFYE